MCIRDRNKMNLSIFYAEVQPIFGFRAKVTYLSLIHIFYKLSGGERRRLYLCTVLMRNPNFLVPVSYTHLDVYKRQILPIYG